MVLVDLDLSSSLTNSHDIRVTHCLGLRHHSRECAGLSGDLDWLTATLALDLDVDGLLLLTAGTLHQDRCSRATRGALDIDRRLLRLLAGLDLHQDRLGCVTGCALLK